MIVLNEARCIEASVRCLLHYCDDVIVIDGGSSDGTFERLLALGREYSQLRVVTWKQVGSRYDQSWCEPVRRNWAANSCLHEWVLTIDADELLDHFPNNYFRESENPLIFDTLNLLTKSEYITHVKTPHDTEIWYPDPHVRFFNKRLARYSNRPLHCVLETHHGELLLPYAIHSQTAIFHYHALVNPDRQWDNEEKRKMLSIKPVQQKLPLWDKFIVF